MLKKLPRVAFVFFANILCTYLLCLLLIVVFSGQPFASGFLTGSPFAAGLVFFLFPSIVTGIGNGFLLNLFLTRPVGKQSHVYSASLICALAIAFLLMIALSLMEGKFNLFSPFFFAMLGVFFVSNLATIALTGKIFHAASSR